MSGSKALFALSVAALAACPAVAAPVVLTHNNSTAIVDPDTNAGMHTWEVDGSDQLFQQWFWYRVGNNPEDSIDTISAPVTVQPTARHATTTYTAANFILSVDYLLTGGALGTGISDIAETISIQNTTGSTLDFHFFQYTDFDLDVTSGNDTVALGTNLAGKFNEAVQVEGIKVLAETVAAPGASRGEVDFYANTLNKLEDGVASNLNNNAGPVGPGDVTWALQWDFTIAPGGTAIISKDKYLVVPEPASLSLLAMGALLGARRRR